jgi:hypothetical protein
VTVFAVGSNYGTACQVSVTGSYASVGIVVSIFVDRMETFRYAWIRHKRKQESVVKRQKDILVGIVFESLIV